MNDNDIRHWNYVELTHPQCHTPLFHSECKRFSRKSSGMVMEKWGLLHNSSWTTQWFVGFNAKACLQNSDHFCPFGKVRVVLITCGTYSVWLLRLSQFLAPEYDYDWLCLLKPNLQNRNQLYISSARVFSSMFVTFINVIVPENEWKGGKRLSWSERIHRWIFTSTVLQYLSILHIYSSIGGFSKPPQMIIQVVSVPAGKMRSPPFSSMS